MVTSKVPHWQHLLQNRGGLRPDLQSEQRSTHDNHLNLQSVGPSQISGRAIKPQHPRVTLIHYPFFWCRLLWLKCLNSSVSHCAKWVSLRGSKTSRCDTLNLRVGWCKLAAALWNAFKAHINCFKIGDKTFLSGAWWCWCVVLRYKWPGQSWHESLQRRSHEYEYKGE